MEPEYFKHYKLDIDFMDNDHLKLIEISDNIRNTINDKEKTMALASEFFEVIKDHFKREEEFMEEINYPFIQYHKDSHKDLLLCLNNLFFNQKSYEAIKQDYFLLTLRKSLLTHVDELDRQIGLYLKTKK